MFDVYSSIIITVTIIAVLLRIYEKTTNQMCLSKKKLNGRTVLVTGGSAGIGLKIALDLARRGARVIIASNVITEGVKAEKNIRAATGNIKVVYKFLDLSSLKIIREFAQDIMNTETRLDILICNAGIGGAGDHVTEDGMQLIMQVNYYGHVLLTILLLPLLKATGTAEEPSRIVNTSSLLHRFGEYTEKVNKAGVWWHSVEIYANSKFSFLSFTRELGNRLRGSNVVVNCIDPGIVGTGIYKITFGGFILTYVSKFIFKNSWVGAQTSLHAALEDEAGKVTGQFFRNCKLSAPRTARATDSQVSEFVWNNSLRLVGVSEEELQTIF